jgi:hypothetical protein
MSEGVVIPLDVDDTKARSKVQRLKQQTQAAGREYAHAAQAGSLAARMGGPMGGLIGRATGGFAMGGAAGAAGAAIAAAAFVGNIVMQANSRHVEMARGRQEYLNQVEQTNRGALLSRRQFEAGSKSVVPTLRRLASSYAKDPMGLAGAQADIANVSAGSGVSATEAADAMLEARAARVSATDTARLVGTGEFNASEAADALRKFGSPERAFAAKMRVSVDDASASLAASGRVNQGGGVAVQEAQFNNVISGRTATAQAEMDAETLNPEAAAKEKMRTAIEAVTRTLKVAAAAQMDCVKDFQDLKMYLGMGDGSNQTKLENYQEVTKD